MTEPSSSARVAPVGLDRLLRPRSVAVVGASATVGSLGHSVLENLDRIGFTGAIHLVNPKRDAIGGRPCLPSIDALPEGVDAAVLAVPGPAVLNAVRALARRGVGAAVIFAAGFAENGEAGLAAQRELARLAEDHAMVIEGPNCLGFVNHADGVALTFVEIPAAPLGGAPGIAIVSQSGAMAVVLGTTLASKGLGVSVSVSTGNEAASGVEDYLDHMLDRPDSGVVAMIVEHFRDPARFLALAARARDAGKPIVLLHPGRSAAARASAATHTGALAGDWEVMRVKVERADVILVERLEEFGDVLDIAARCRTAAAGTRMAQGGVAILTESGAFKALSLDLCDAIGLPLPPPSDVTTARLRAVVPAFVPVSNPMDLTAQALVDPDLYRRALEPFLEDHSFAAVLLGIIQTDVATAERKLPPIIAAVRSLAPAKPLILAGLDEGAPVRPERLAALRSLGVPYFPSPDRAIRALNHVLKAAGRSGGAVERAPSRLALPPDGGTLPEHVCKALLGPVGIPVPPGDLAADLGEALRAAAEVGYPVALKAQAAALSHKSDVGGVMLGLADEAALTEGWARLQAALGRHAPGLALDGVLVERMAPKGVELIVGARNEPGWGPAILVGFGGVQAELAGDVRLMAHDLARDGIAAALRGLRSGALFDGYRGSPRLDLDAVIDVVEALGHVLVGNPRIREIDLNPVVVYPAGDGATALDAVMTVAPA